MTGPGTLLRTTRVDARSPWHANRHPHDKYANLPQQQGHHVACRNHTLPRDIRPQGSAYSASFNTRRYQWHGTYTWPVVRAKHEANLMFVLDDPPGWETAMVAELGAPKFHGAWIRIHDAGDFFSDTYLQAWLRICRARPDVNFYAYTKEVDRLRRLAEPNPPANFLWVYSYGGKQDSALEPATDRVAYVFPDEAAIAAAGWASQDASDLLAVLGPRLVGVPANRIPAYLKRLAGRRFSEWQAEVDAERAARQNRRRLHLVVDNTHPATEPGRAAGDIDQPRAA